MQETVVSKNSGHLWLAYTELQGAFNMLQLISVDSGHFTQPELWQYQVKIWACSGTTSYIQMNHRQLLIKSTLHSYIN